MIVLAQRDHPTWVLYIGVQVGNSEKRLILKESLKDDYEEIDTDGTDIDDAVEERARAQV